MQFLLEYMHELPVSSLSAWRSTSYFHMQDQESENIGSKPFRRHFSWNDPHHARFMIIRINQQFIQFILPSQAYHFSSRTFVDGYLKALRDKSQTSANLDWSIGHKRNYLLHAEIRHLTLSSNDPRPVVELRPGCEKKSYYSLLSPNIVAIVGVPNSKSPTSPISLSENIHSKWTIWSTSIP